MVEAIDKTSAFLDFVGKNLDEILCIQETRVVGKDNTIRYDGKILQIRKDTHRHHYVKCEVIVHKKLDESLVIFYGNRCLGEFDKNGKIIVKEEVKQRLKV